MYLLARLAKTADLKDLEHPNNIKPLKNILKIFMSKFHDYFAFMRYSRTSLATSSRKRSPIQNSARVYPCSGSPTDSTSYWNSLGISLEPDWQIDYTFFNRPVMARTQILVHN